MDNDIRFDENEKNTYRAVSNLNTAIENPQINMNSVVGVNIKSVDSTNPINDVYSSNLKLDSTNPINGVYSSNLQTNDSYHSFQMNEMIESDQQHQQLQGNLENGMLVNNNDSLNEVQKQFNSETSQFNSTFIPTDFNTESGLSSESSLNSESMVDIDSSYVATSFNEQVNYEPVMQEMKKKGVTFKVTREFKVMLFIVFILFIFILVVPYIYDFFKELQLVTTTG